MARSREYWQRIVAPMVWPKIKEGATVPKLMASSHAQRQIIACKQRQARTEANSRAQPNYHQIDEDESKKTMEHHLRGGDGGDHCGKDYS
jgi:hypothetical protein